MFAKWMQIGSVIYVCHYIFLHLPDDSTETNGCSQGQSSGDQSLLCRSNVPHLTPCCCSWGWLSSTHLLPPDLEAQADLQRYCTLKFHLLHSPGPLQSFALGFLSFRAKCMCQLGLYHTLIQHASLKSKLLLFLYLFKIWWSVRLTCHTLPSLLRPMTVMVWLLWLLTTLRQDC